MLVLREAELCEVRENRAVLESCSPELGRFFAGDVPVPEAFSITKPREGVDKLSVLVMCDYGRGGNIYITIANAIAFCLHHSVSMLYIHFPEKRRLYSNLFCFNGDSEAEDVRQSAHGLAKGEGCLAIRGVFPFLHLHQYFPETGEASTYGLHAVKMLESAFRIKTIDSLPQSTLVVHIRGGDLFSREVYLKSVQPPLAWYAICIREHEKRHGKIGVVIVSEDRGNPCVDGLLEWCGKHSVEARLQSGTFEEDYAWLMRAGALVDSCGTFATMAKHLNRNLKRVYTFQPLYCREGTYVSQWENREEQKQKMLTLPESALRVPDDLYEISRWEALVIKADSLPPLKENLIVQKAGFVARRKTWKDSCLKIFANIVAAPMPSRSLKKRVKKYILG